jgi:glycogen debranching enzyme
LTAPGYARKRQKTNNHELPNEIIALKNLFTTNLFYVTRFAMEMTLDEIVREMNELEQHMQKFEWKYSIKSAEFYKLVLAGNSKALGFPR